MLFNYTGDILDTFCYHVKSYLLLPTAKDFRA